MQAQLKVEVQANTNTLPKAKFGKGRQHIAINQADKPVLSCQTVFFKILLCTRCPRAVTDNVVCYFQVLRLRVYETSQKQMLKT